MQNIYFLLKFNRTYVYTFLLLQFYYLEVSTLVSAAYKRIYFFCEKSHEHNFYQPISCHICGALDVSDNKLVENM